MLARWKPHVALLLVVAGLLTGCEPAQIKTIDTWVASEMVPLTDRTERIDNSTVFDSRERKVSLFGAANEAIAFQLVVDGGDAEVWDVRVKFSNLYSPDKKKISADSIRMFRMLPVDVHEYPAWYVRLSDRPGEPARFYDVLVPVGARGYGQPFKLERNERLAIWVDLCIPRDAASDEYTGMITVTARGYPEQTFRLELKVYDFVLPEARALPAMGAFSHRALFATFLQRSGKPFVPVYLDRKLPEIRDGLALMRQLMRLAHEHRLDLFDRAIRPVMKRDTSGKVRIDWEDYDAIVTPYLSGSAFDDSIGVAGWAVPFWEEFPDAGRYGGIHSKKYVGTASAMVTAIRDHFAEIPESHNRMFVWGYRRSVTSAGYEHQKQFARIYREVDPETPILSRLPVKLPKLTTWKVPEDLADLTDIFAPPGQWLDPSSISPPSDEHPLRGTWICPGLGPYIPPLGVLAGPADIRALPWFAMKYNCSALLLPEVLNWSGDMLSSPAGSDTRWFYPGSIIGLQQVLPSVRLKRLRRGLQDLGYLWLLKTRRRPAIADSVIQALTRYAALDACGDHYLDPRLHGWVRDGRTWEMARKVLAEEVNAVIHTSRLTNTQLLAQRVRWKALHDRARRVRLERTRSRLVPTGAGTFRAETTLELYNEYSRLASVRIDLTALPDGWTALKGETQIDVIPPRSRHTVTLLAEGSYVPTGSSAKMRLPILLTTDSRRQRRIVTYVPFLMVGRAHRPPTIDGVLDDWPMRPGNTATDFRVIGRRGASDGREGGVARRGTAVFVTRDDENLYIAFRCDEPNMNGMTAHPSNVVHYEQLMACGEDLVEILLDPGCSATSAEQLYHIVVKPNGVMVTERGIGCSPPLGVVRSWAADILVGIDWGKKLWVVEMAIPLRAFGQAGKSELWGVNFMRYASQTSESSSWSGAARYYYSLKNMGTMYIPQDNPSHPR